MKFRINGYFAIYCLREFCGKARDQSSWLKEAIFYNILIFTKLYDGGFGDISISTATGLKDLFPVFNRLAHLPQLRDFFDVFFCNLQFIKIATAPNIKPPYIANPPFLKFKI